MKRRKMTQEHNIQLAKDKKELEKKLSQVHKECNRLQKKAHALDGIDALEKDARGL